MSLEQLKRLWEGQLPYPSTSSGRDLCFVDVITRPSMLTQRAGQPAVNKTQEKNQQIKLAKKLVQSRDQRVGERSKLISVDFEFF